MIEPNNTSTGTAFLLQDFLARSTKLHPGKMAIACDSGRISYEELDKASNLLSHALIGMGVERGDRVLVFAGNTMETAIAFWAILKANAVVSIINSSTKADKLAYLLNDSRARVLITEERLAPVFAEACPQSAHLSGILVSGEEPMTTGSQLPNRVAWQRALEGVSLQPGKNRPPVRECIDIDLAAIIYTSGSTGEPKGVMLTHRNMIAAASSIVSYLEMAEDDVVLNVFPFSFDYGLYQMILCILSGASLILEESFAYPALALKRIAEERVTGFPGVPSVFSMMENMRDLSKFDFSSVRFVTNTAAALSLKNIRFLRKTFPAARIFSMYGLTECKRCSYLPPEDIEKKPLSVGIPIPNTEFWVEDEKGRRLGPNEAGILVVRGATVMKGYWGKPEETAQKLRPGSLPGELVLHTGDLCRIDEEGYLYFVGRTDDIIKTRGEKVAPKEIENVIHDIPGVREVAVTGVEDDVLGQAIKAFVSLEEGCTLTGKAILADCSGRLENFMIPKYIEIVPELPKTATGKIKKTILSELSEDNFLVKAKS